MNQIRQFTYDNTETLSHNHCYCGKAVSFIYSECVSVALFIQHAMRMRRIILSSVACLDLQYFSILSRKRHGFRGEVGRKLQGKNEF
jgi:hypothetical protein